MANLATKDLVTIPDDLDIWFTEYNLFERERPLHETWSYGLFAAAQSLSFLADKRIQLINFHSAIGNAVSGVLFRGETGYTYDFVPALPGPALTVRYDQTARADTSTTSYCHAERTFSTPPGQVIRPTSVAGFLKRDRQCS